jgi:teichuronic acid exporter
MSIVQQARIGMIWGVSSKILNQILSWVVTIWVIRLLTPEDFAIIALSDLTIGFFLIVGKFGFQGALVKANKLSSAQINQTFTLLVLINLLLFCLFQLVAPEIANYLKNESLEALIRISSLSFVLSPFITVSLSLIYRNMQYKKLAQLGFFINLAQIATNLVLALLGYGFWALAIGLLVSQIVCAIMYCYIAGFIPKLDFYFKGIKGLLSDSNFSFFTGTTWELTHRVDIFLINSLVGTTALGIYRIGLSLAEKPVSLVGQMIQQIGLSSFSKISNDKELVGKYVVKASSIIAFVSFPLFFGIASISPSLVPLVLGEKWLLAIIPLQILCMIQLVNVLKEVTGSALFAVGQAKRKLIQALVVLISAAAAWEFGLQLGFITGCITFVVVYITWFIWHVNDTAKFINLKGYWNHLLIPLFMSVSMFIVVYTIGLTSNDSPFVFTIILQVICGVMSYAIVGWLFFKAHCLTTLKLLRKNR